MADNASSFGEFCRIGGELPLRWSGFTNSCKAGPMAKGYGSVRLQVFIEESRKVRFQRALELQEVVTISASFAQF